MLSLLWLPVIAFFLVWGTSVAQRLYDDPATEVSHRDRITTTVIGLLIMSIGLGVLVVVFT